MSSSSLSLSQLQQRIHRVTRFLSATLSIANAHTVEFYTHDVWTRFVDVTPEEVLSAFSAAGGQQGKPEPGEPDHTGATYGLCPETNRLVDVQQLLLAARDHSLPGLGVCWARDELLQALGAPEGGATPAGTGGAELELDEFMNSKKSHEVQSMSEVVSFLAKHCGVQQVIDVGSGKGYLSSFLSLQFGLQVYGIDSSSTNTHGAQERNRKLKKFSKVYQKSSSAARARENATKSPKEEEEEPTPEVKPGDRDGIQHGPGATIAPRGDEDSPPNLGESEDFFLAMAEDVMETPSPRVPPGRLSQEERERRKRENLERKARSRGEAAAVFSPLTSYVTAETELRELIGELEDAVMVGLHTCGDLAPSTLRMFAAKPELRAVCSVGCCYHLLSEEFDPAGREPGVFGFPLSQCLRSSSSFCGRNARMSACLALERVSLGQGIQMESLFYRAVLHVILRDHYSSFKSERRVGNVYSKAKSFQDYVRRALRRLELDDSKLSDDDILRYLDTFRPRMAEMTAFNVLKVTLAPCIEGLILLDRLCFLREQDNVSLSALVQLFDPLLSPRCYAVVGLKRQSS